jgi:hypothetical protein
VVSVIQIGRGNSRGTIHIYDNSYRLVVQRIEELYYRDRPKDVLGLQRQCTSSLVVDG